MRAKKDYFIDIKCTHIYLACPYIWSDLSTFSQKKFSLTGYKKIKKIRLHLHINSQHRRSVMGMHKVTAQLSLRDHEI